MTDGKLPYDVDEESARVRDEFDRYLGALAPKRKGPGDPCDGFDPETRPFCEHFPKCVTGDTDP